MVLRQADTSVIRDLHVFKLKRTFFFSQQDAANLYLNMDAVQADILATNIVNIPADCLAKGKTSSTGMLFAVMGKSTTRNIYRIVYTIYGIINSLLVQNLKSI